MHNCDITKFTRPYLEEFFRGICDDVLDMERCDLHFWDDEGIPAEEIRTEPEVVGISAVQFIITSNITIHTLTKLRAVIRGAGKTIGVTTGKLCV